MTLFKQLIAVGLLAVGSLIWSSCATLKPEATYRLKYIEITADETAMLTVTCDDEYAYQLKIGKDETIEIGGPEAICRFTVRPGVGLDMEAVWE